jgi:hypothetical protein
MSLPDYEASERQCPDGNNQSFVIDNGGDIAVVQHAQIEEILVTETCNNAPSELDLAEESRIDLVDERAETCNNAPSEEPRIDLVIESIPSNEEKEADDPV